MPKPAGNKRVHRLHTPISALREDRMSLTAKLTAARDRLPDFCAAGAKRAGQGRARLAHRDRAADRQGLQRHRPPVRGEESRRQDRGRGARLGRPRRQDHGLARGRRAAGAVARPADHLHGAAVEGPAAAARRGGEGDRRGQHLGSGQARLQCRRQAVRPRARGRHVAADLSQGHRRQGRPEAAEDLEPISSPTPRR